MEGGGAIFGRGSGSRGPARRNKEGGEVLEGERRQKEGGAQDRGGLARTARGRAGMAAALLAPSRRCARETKPAESGSGQERGEQAGRRRGRQAGHAAERAGRRPRPSGRSGLLDRAGGSLGRAGVAGWAEK